MQLRLRPRARLVALVLTTVSALGLVGPAEAAAKTFAVTGAGSDSAAGSTAAPFATLARAASVARSGDVVEVAPGRYRETVPISGRNTGVTFRGVGDSRPVIDGDGTHAFGFRNVNADNLTVENFEITGQTQAGIYSQGSRGSFARNVVHHVGSPSEVHSNGIRIVRGGANQVEDNVIHHVGPGSESMGIWLVETRDAVVQGNSVSLVRKEGIRDWKGLDNSIAGNRVFLNWAGISLNTSTGSTVADNYAYDNTEGIAVKHASYKSVLSYWGLGTGHWTRVTQNTVHRSTETSLWIGQSDEPLDYLDVRGNTFAGAGTAFVRDSPSLRGPHVTVDQNQYSDQGGKPSYLYKAGWSSAPGIRDWAEYRKQTGWENAGGPSATTLSALGGSDISWTPFSMTAIDSSSKGTWWTKSQLQASADNNQNSYWLTSGNQNEFVTYDFGEQRTLNHLILTVFSHGDNRNPRGYRFEVSDDGHSWRTVLSGVNGDSAGSAIPYELPGDQTARYLRFTMVDTFCASYSPRQSCGAAFVLSDLKAGRVAPGAQPQDENPAPATPEAPVAPADPPPTGTAPAPQAPAPVSRPPVGPTSPTQPALPMPALKSKWPLSVGKSARLDRQGRLRLALTSSKALRRKLRTSITIASMPSKSPGPGASTAVTLGHTWVIAAPRSSRTVELGLRKGMKRARLRRVAKLRVTLRAPGMASHSVIVKVR